MRNSVFQQPWINHIGSFIGADHADGPFVVWHMAHRKRNTNWVNLLTHLRCSPSHLKSHFNDSIHHTHISDNRPVMFTIGSSYVCKALLTYSLVGENISPPRKHICIGRRKFRLFDVADTRHLALQRSSRWYFTYGCTIADSCKYQSELITCPWLCNEYRLRGQTICLSC